MLGAKNFKKPTPQKAGEKRRLSSEYEANKRQKTAQAPVLVDKLLRSKAMQLLAIGPQALNEVVEKMGTTKEVITPVLKEVINQTFPSR